MARESEKDNIAGDGLAPVGGDGSTPADTPKRVLSLMPVIGLIAAFSAAAGVTLHLMGVAFHDAYLQSWGLDSGLFPKSADWLVIAGYMAVFDRGVLMVGLMNANTYWTLGGFLLGGLILVLLVYVESPNPAKLSKSGKPQSSLLFGERLCNALLLLAGVYLSWLVVLLLMAGPVAAGGFAGEAEMRRKAKAYSKGCGEAAYACVQVKKGTDVLGQGFVIESSTSHIAIYDVEKKQARAIPRDDTETAVIAVAKR